MSSLTIPAFATDQDRCLPPGCGFNVRDFGGYPTADGGHVRVGMLYRAGTMADLDEAATAQLRALGIVAICDLRSSGERTHSPTLWHKLPDVEYWARDYAHSGGDLVRILMQAGSAEEVRTLMLGYYREVAYEQLESYREMFGMLLRGRVPMLVNCSAGKDRTGAAVALVLAALGVARETIEADYVLTERADFSRLFAMMRPEHIPRLAGELGTPLIAADPRYLEAMFATIDANEGSVDAYLEERLGVGAAERVRLRALLVDG